MTRFLVPLGFFLLLLVFLGVGLTLNPREIPSPLIDNPAPPFKLAQLRTPEKTFSSDDMRGRVWLLNVWASWCVSCRDEHPVLLGLAKTGMVPIQGLNYKDKREDALNWLNRFGDPYTLAMSDREGRVGIDYGVYGVPETYVIDKAGVIRYKHIGPLSTDAIQSKIIPLVKKLNAGA